MKYLKLFEDKKYSKNLYYESELDSILKDDWKELSITRDTINFEVGEGYDKGYKYSVFFEGQCSDNDIFLEETAIPKFIKKFKEEFQKNPEKYSHNFKVGRFKRDPKFMGDLSHFRETEKYNL